MTDQDGTPLVRLAPLSDAGEYRVCKDDIDPRGWAVADSNDVVLGSVSDLIIDLAGLTARYMVCAITRGDERAVLIPTGFFRLDPGRCVAHLDFVTALDIERLPAYTGLPLSAEQGAWMEEVLTGSSSAPREAKIVRRSDTTPNAS